MRIELPKLEKVNNISIIQGIISYLETQRLIKV